MQGVIAITTFLLWAGANVHSHLASYKAVQQTSIVIPVQPVCSLNWKITYNRVWRQSVRCYTFLIVCGEKQFPQKLCNSLCGMNQNLREPRLSLVKYSKSFLIYLVCLSKFILMLLDTHRILPDYPSIFWALPTLAHLVMLTSCCLLVC